MKTKLSPKANDFFLLNLGTFLVAAGVYFFKFPNNFSTGGVTGIAIVVSKFVPNISTGTLVFLFNILLLVVGFFFLSRKFGLKTVYSSLLMSAIIWILERVYPMSAPFTNDPLLELIFAVGLPAFGSAILFNINASTGGTDIIAMLLKKYTNTDIGKSLLLADFLVALSSGFVFGVRTGLFSILGLLMKSLLVDSVIESINQCKYMHIVCSKPDDICDYIGQKLHRGATICNATGAYTHHNLYLVLTVMNRPQAAQLRRYVHETDPHAFIMITNTSEIIGNGFRGGN